MGTYIRYVAEKQDAKGKWEPVVESDEFLLPQDYDLYGWLGCDARNYAALSRPSFLHEGDPLDFDRDSFEEYYGYQWLRWVLIADLLAFDYDAQVEDRRDQSNTSGAKTLPEGQGTMTTYRELFCSTWFEDLERMRQSGATRLVYWFD